VVESLKLSNHNGIILLTAGSIAPFLTSHPLFIIAQRWLMGTILIDLATRLVFESRNYS
jgi:hypothetical protein